MNPKLKIITSAKTIVFFLLLTNSISLYAQKTNRWFELDASDIKTTMIDTTNLRITDNQLSVWVLEIFNEPFELENSDLRAKRTRTQYLFDLTSKKFSIIGNLKYDEVGKIISQNYNPFIGGNEKAFYQDNNSNPMVTALFKKINNYLGNETSTPVDSENSDIVESVGIASNYEIPTNDDDSTNKFIQDDSSTISKGMETNQFSDSPKKDADLQVEKSPVTQQIIEKSQKKIIPEEPQTAAKKNDSVTVNDSSSHKRSVSIYDPSSGKSFNITKNKESVPVNNVKESIPAPEKKVETNHTYNNETEKNISGTIFSDGKLFCIQISSWKTKSIAERELNKLLKSGHNAFVVDANPKHKKGTWHRVRIGYFNSLEEAKVYQNSLK